MCADLGMVGPEFVGLPEKALTQDAKRRLRHAVRAAGWLDSMVIHGRLCWCASHPRWHRLSRRQRCQRRQQ